MSCDCLLFHILLFYSSASWEVAPIRSQTSETKETNNLKIKQLNKFGNIKNHLNYTLFKWVENCFSQSS